MKAVDSHLLTLLKASSQFIVPIYQRLYSWQEPECAQLWADIVRAGSNPKLGAHFTGSIVYVAKDQSTNTSAEPDLIIDGQQRVTTVTLILTALAARLEQLARRPAGALGRLLAEEDPEPLPAQRRRGGRASVQADPVPERQAGA